MNELEAMKQQLARLEQETLALKAKSKSQTARQRFLLCFAVVGIGLTLAASNVIAQGGAQNLVCRSLKVVDDDGKTILLLGASADGQGQFSLYNYQYKRVIAMGATGETGSGVFGVYDPEAKIMVNIGSDAGTGTGKIWTQK